MSNVPCFTMPRHAGPTADIYEIRRRNLRVLVDEYAAGSLTHFVEGTLKGSLSYKALQNVTGPSRKRNLGSMLARRIEVQLKLPRGWMDLERSGVVQAWPIPNGRSERVMRLAESIASLSPPMRVPIEQIVEALKEVSKRKGGAA
jgi:hypothetical protein